MTYDEYRRLEDVAEERHIFWDGEVFAMSGASDAHNTIETNAAVLLSNALRGSPCRASTGNRRLRALDSERGVYADAVVICGGAVLHPDDGNASTNPTVILEVLSDSTEAFDRGEKFAYYRSFPSMREVVFLSQKSRHVERYARGDGGAWTLTEVRGGDQVVFDAIQARFAVDDLYEGTSIV